MNRTIILLLVCVLSLVVLSVWSLSSALMLSRKGDAMILNQFGAVLIGFLGFAVMSWVDYRRFNRQALAMAVYGATILLLIAVLIPGVGTYRNGAQRWLFFFQPSEIAKAALVLSLAWYGARFQHRMSTFRWGFLGAGCVALPILGLIFKEPDRGTTLFLLGLTIMVLLIAGVRWHFMALAAVVAGGVLIPILKNDPLVQKRLAAYNDPEAHKSAAAYQNRQALLAFGEGGLFGKGPGAGVMMRTIPEQHTDFILPVIGEELGFIGSSMVVLAFVGILFCGARIARQAADAGDTFGLLLAAGITFLIVAQAYFNIGIVTKMFPNKGLPLPFVSRGGTNIVVMLTLVGTLISVARHTPRAVLPLKATLRSGEDNPFAEFPA